MHCVSHFLCFPWCCPRKNHPGDTGQPSSTHPSPNLGTSQEEHLPIGRTQNDSGATHQLTHASVIPEHPNPTPTPDPLGSTAQPLALPIRPTSFDQSEHHALLAVPQQSQAPTTASHDFLFAQQLTPPSSQPLSQLRDGSPGIHYGTQNIHESRNVSVEGNRNHISYNYTGTVVNDLNDFMEKLLEKTILGAAFDSSARDPPPRCHPGTRLAILERCLCFIVDCHNNTKMRWVVGAAGVGKSAVMQSIAEHPLTSVPLRASIFFFVDGRNDGSKTIVTLAYQLAVQSEPYRQFIKDEITRDPSLLQKSMSTQFQKFIVQPFIHHPQLSSTGRILIIIDGLDECDKTLTQRDLLQLIVDLCLTYPSSPIVWMIASRPEPHITSLFAEIKATEAYEKEDILVDSHQGREDVEKFLRGELRKMQSEYSLNIR